MEPTTKPIIVRYKKLGREKVLGLADLDTQEIIIDPRQPSKELMGTLMKIAQALKDFHGED
jgi:hypothetical protein